MGKTINAIREEALALSASERASLAHDLILTLDDAAGLELSPEQEREIARRVRLVQKGKAAGRPAEEVFAEIRAQHSR
jgi:putative addiction module component (TIGR02574 family)